MVPQFDKFMRPFLEFLGDGKNHTLKECVQEMVNHFGLSEEDVAEMVPSKVETKVHNRTNWAMTYLKKAGLTASEKRGVYHITEEGKHFLRENEGEITVPVLREYSATFREFSKPSSNAEKNVHSDEDEQDNVTPEEMLTSAYQQINDRLADEILQKLLHQSPKYFERIVVDLMEKMGYGDGTITPYTGDEGIDGIINEDKLGLDKVYLQAKKYNAGETVGSRAIREFIGSVSSHGGSKGVFITTSSFAKKVYEVHDPHVKLILIDGKKLAQLMIQYNLGVTTIRSYEVKRIDSDYFEEE